MTTLIDISKARAAKQITLKIEIRGARRLRFRLWLAAKIFAAAAAVAGSRAQISTTIRRAGDQ